MIKLPPHVRDWQMIAVCSEGHEAVLQDGLNDAVIFPSFGSVNVSWACPTCGERASVSWFSDWA